MKTFVFDGGWYGYVINAESLTHARQLLAENAKQPGGGVQSEKAAEDARWTELPMIAGVVYEWCE